MKKFFNTKTIIFLLSLAVLIESLVLLRSCVKQPPPAAPPRPPVAVLKGRIAIVLDDWGYNLFNLPVLEKVKYPLTLAVLPGLKYSAEISRVARRIGKEVILHLPMEPDEKLRLETNTVLASMDESAIVRIMDKDVAAVPGIKGISNHMGSKVTRDPRTMTIILNELKKRKLYFLDSVVSSKSVGFRLARELRVPCAKRDVFLDNTEEAGYIRRQIEVLKNRARIYGYAVGIGHDRGVTLRVLAEAAPQMAAEGYKFVFVSELLDR